MGLSPSGRAVSVRRLPEGGVGVAVPRSPAQARDACEARAAAGAPPPALVRWSRPPRRARELRGRGQRHIKAVGGGARAEPVSAGAGEAAVPASSPGPPPRTPRTLQLPPPRLPWPAGRAAPPPMGAAATAAAGEASRAPWVLRAGRAGVRGGRPGPPPDAVCRPQSAAPSEMEPWAEAPSRREAQEARRRRGPREAGGRGPPGQVGPECGAGVGRPGVPPGLGVASRALAVPAPQLSRPEGAVLLRRRRSLSGGLRGRCASCRAFPRHSRRGWFRAPERPLGAGGQRGGRELLGGGRGRPCGRPLCGERLTGTRALWGERAGTGLPAVLRSLAGPRFGREFGETQGAGVALNTLAARGAVCCEGEGGGRADPAGEGGGDWSRPCGRSERRVLHEWGLCGVEPFKDALLGELLGQRR